MNIVEPFIRQASRTPAAVAVRMGARSVTYGQLLDGVGRQAAAFAAAGVKPGERVIVAGKAGPATTLALAWIGAISVEAYGDADRLASTAKRLGIDHAFLPGNAPSAFPARRVHGLQAIVGAAAAEPPPVRDVAPGDIWRIATSSGTTGVPKGIAFSHECSILQVAALSSVYPVQAGDGVLVGMPLAMSFAVHNWLRCFYWGGTLVSPEPFTEPHILDLLHGGGIQHAIVGVGTLTALAARAEAEGSAWPAPAPKLRVLSVGGARVSPRLQQVARERICANLYCHYGASETHLVAVLDATLQALCPDSAGRILPWMEVQAVGVDGAPLPPGAVGRLRIRSAFLAAGYVGVGPEEARAFRDGWFYSQDVGHVTPDGIIHLEGRSSEVMNFGGVKVNAAVLEEAVTAAGDITECAALDLPDGMGQPQLAVVYVAAKDIDVAEIRRRCRTVSASLQLRHAYRVLDGGLPRNEGGKVARQALRNHVLKQLRNSQPAPTP